MMRIVQPLFTGVLILYLWAKAEYLKNTGIAWLAFAFVVAMFVYTQPIQIQMQINLLLFVITTAKIAVRTLYMACHNFFKELLCHYHPIMFLGSMP